MRLNHNMFSLSAYSTYSKNLVKNADALGRISSGVKLQSAKDNPSKISSSELFNIQIKSLESAGKNVQDGVSMVQTAEGALNEVSDMLCRMKELAVSAADGTKSSDDIGAIQTEMDQLTSAINDISNQTSFNGVKMLAESSVTNNSNPLFKEAQIGYTSKEKLSIPFYNTSTDRLGINGISVSTQMDASNAISAVDAAIAQVAEIRGGYGAVSNRLETTFDDLSMNSINLDTVSSRLTDADIATEIAEYSKTNILTQASIAIIAQTNNIPKNALDALKNTM